MHYAPLVNKSKVAAHQRLEIVALKGHQTAAALGERYDVSRSLILYIWAQDARAQLDRARAPLKQKVSALTGLLVYPVKPPPEPYQGEPLTANGKLFLDLAPADCRWPIGRDCCEPDALRFCGEPRAGQSRVTAMYCAAHAKAALARSPKEQALAAGLMPPPLTLAGPVLSRDFDELEIA